MQTCNLQYERLSIVFSIPNNAFPTTLKLISYMIFKLSISQCIHKQAPEPNWLLCGSCGYIITIFIHILERIVGLHILTGNALNKNNKVSKE